MKTLLLIIAGITISLAFSSCIAHSTLGGTKDWMPQNMDIKNTILLVEKYPASEKQNRKMQAHLKETYKGKYIVVDKKDIQDLSGKYSDTTLYRYGLLWRDGRVAGGTYSSPRNNYYVEAHFFDRAQNKTYPETGRTYIYAQKAYVPVINTIAKQAK